MKKICCIFNYPSHYRYAIYKHIEDNLNVDYYFGNKLKTKIKTFDVYLLKSFRGYVENKFLFKGFIQKRLIALFLSKKYDAFLITGDVRNFSLWIILLLNLFIKKDIALWTHGWYGKEKGVQRILKKIFYKLSSHVFLYGEYAKNKMIDEGLSSHKLSCLFNSLDFFNQVEIRNRTNSSDIYRSHFKNNYPVLCFIGRVQAIKKIEQIIEAMRLLISKKGFYTNLVVIGSGKHLETLKLYTGKNNLEKYIWFYGPSYDEEVNANLLYNADLCVSPGNVGLTAVHALTYGCPVVTHASFEYQMPEFEVIKPGVTGDFFVKDNISDLAHKIYVWLTLPKKREYVRRHCYHIIDSKYNPEFQVGILRSYYESSSNK